MRIYRIKKGVYSSDTDFRSICPACAEGSPSLQKLIVNVDEETGGSVCSLCGISQKDLEAEGRASYATLS